MLRFVKLGCGRGAVVAVGVAFDAELVAGGGEPVDGGLGEEVVVHEGEPFVGGAVGGDDGGVLAVPGDGELVEVAGGGFAERLEGEVVDLSGVRTKFCHIFAGGDVAYASVRWLAGGDAVLVQE